MWERILYVIKNYNNKLIVKCPCVKNKYFLTLNISITIWRKHQVTTRQTNNTWKKIILKKVIEIQRDC
jgi:hypothetical protein